MDEQKQKIDYSKISPQLAEKIKGWEAATPSRKHLETLSDIADIVQEIVSLLDEGKKEREDFGALFVDMREALDAIRRQETPEMPDYAEPVVGALDKLESAVTKALADIELSPKITVPKTAVNVPAPVVTVGTEEVAKVLKKDLPAAFKKAVSAIPKVDIPETDNTELYARLDSILEALESIDTASRLKPQLPTQLKVVNPDGSNIGSSSSPAYQKLAGSDANLRDSSFYGDGITAGVAAVHQRYFDGSSYNRTSAAKKLIDKTTTTNVIYIGSAPIGTATSSAAWQIKKVDKTTSPISITYAASGAFTATWNNRATSETYS